MMRAVAVAIAVAMATPALAVQPDEILSDPLLEERARELSKGLRCLVCRNESIDESNAELARDLRLLVRERLVAGDSNDEVIEFVVDRYGEYVLLKPLATGANRILYWAAPAMLLLSLGIGSLYIRERRRPEEAVEGLSEDEEERLKEILRK
jgi:cytochrome c-type biogenesis protein CcmH